jgi:hypothetical protein
MVTMTTAVDDMTVMIEDCENVLLSAIPILSGGMVDIALSEFGASIVDVCLDEDLNSLGLDEPVDPTIYS